MHLKRQWIVSQEDNSGLQMTRRQPYDCMRPLNYEKEQRRPILECNYLDNKGFGTITLNINSLFFSFKFNNIVQSDRSDMVCSSENI